MDWTKDAVRDEATYLRTFLINQGEELRLAPEFLSADDLKEFTTYYHALIERPLTGSLLERQVRGGLRGTYGYILARLLRERGNRPLRVLDAGSGLGTECILFGLSGAEVLGIDLREERHVVARRRIAFYEETLGLKLQVEFRLTNIFDLRERDYFDLIWVHNAISHIHPVDGFLNLSREMLAPGGDIVVVDANRANLHRKLKPASAHGVGGYTTWKDPNTGKEIVYAVERDLSVIEQCRAMEKAGLRVVSRECLVGLHGKAGNAFYEGILRPINRCLPVSSLMGTRYVVVGRKAST
jgi:2-polyprenyl-3-methyl-5-hydroxy-6-metoxy-1,4-benzoquinol methylase